MTPDELRAACLAQKAAVEDFPFGPETSVFKVAGKVFAISGLDAEPLAVSLKSDPELALSLRAAHPEIRPGYHLNKRHWNTVTIDGSLTEQMIIGMIEDSYDLVVTSLTRAQRAALDHERGR
jgi:predicted DNA-binding protein (MmcQ/YjbR family)